MNDFCFVGYFILDYIHDLKHSKSKINSTSFFFGKLHSDVTGTVQLPEGTEMVMPGDNVTATFELLNPVAMEPGLRFAIREGGRTVGAGVVSKVVD